MPRTQINKIFLRKGTKQGTYVHIFTLGEGSGAGRCFPAPQVLRSKEKPPSRFTILPFLPHVLGRSTFEDLSGTDHVFGNIHTLAHVHTHGHMNTRVCVHMAWGLLKIFPKKSSLNSCQETIDSELFSLRAAKS